MKIKFEILIFSMVVFTACASIAHNPNKPEMSVPDESSYKSQPRTFNQFHKDWDY